MRGGGCATCAGSGLIRVLGRPPAFCACAAGRLLEADAAKKAAPAPDAEKVHPEREGGTDGGSRTRKKRPV